MATILPQPPEHCEYRSSPIHATGDVSLQLWGEALTFPAFVLLSPQGYAFLLFQEESSVQALIDACLEEDGKLYLCVSSPTIKDKPVSDL